MPIKQADEQKLDNLFALHKGTYSGGREDYFAFLYLTRKFGAEPEEIAHQVSFGNNDYGFDAYFLDRPGKNLYLFQFKWTEDHQQFKKSLERLTADGMNRVFGNVSPDPTKSDLLIYLKRDLAECRDLIERVYVHFVFKGDVDAADKSDGLSHRREDLQAKQHLVWQYFGREAQFDVAFISDKPGMLAPRKREVFDVHVDGRGVALHDGRAMHVGFLSLTALHEMYGTLGQLFFDRNIRASLSQDNAPNRKIREALDRIVLRQVDEPSVFAFRHNGVTIAAERVEALDDGKMVLHVPRLLNGAQTVSSLARFLEQNRDNPALRRSKDRLDAIQVLAKIIEDDPSSDFVTQVTISNNQQNPVHPWALRAMDRRQVDFADKFREELGIYYSRQEGAFESLSGDELEEMGIESDRDIRIKPLAMTFLAVQGDVANMKNLSEVFESQKLYESTFKQSYQHVDARAIILAYKAGQMIGWTMRKLDELAPKWLGPGIPKSKNLVWALLLQGILNHPRYPALLEEYGLGLTKEATFGDVLRQIASSRILPLLKDLCAVPAYKAKVEEGKFEFYRTSEAYRRAMDIARDKFRWSKRSF
jgi:hypothetical protein